MYPPPSLHSAFYPFFYSIIYTMSLFLRPVVGPVYNAVDPNAVVWGYMEGGLKTIGAL